MTTEAEPQAPSPTAVAVRPNRAQLASLNPDHDVLITVKQVGGLPPERADVERIEHIVTLPAAYQFQMGSVKTKREKRGNDWQDVLDPDTRRPIIDDTRKVGITSDGYLFLNKTLGYDIVLTEEVSDREGQMVRNPIHGPTYAAIRGGIVYRSDFGQLMWSEETVEADFWHVYQDARINTYSAKVVKKDGVPVLDADGFPIFELSDDDERAAARTLSALRASGLKRLKTTLDVRLLKFAIGIKSLPIRSPQPVDIRLVTFRDALTPEERREMVQRSAGQIFGGTGIKRSLAQEEVDAIAGEQDDQDAAFLGREEADRVEQSRESQGARRADEVAGAYRPDAEDRIRQDPATIPGVQRGVDGVRNVTPPEATSTSAPRGMDSTEPAKPITAPFDAADLRDLE